MTGKGPMDPDRSCAESSGAPVSSNGNITKLYSYVVARDLGFAPNPFYGFCTLATCKPGIRRMAKAGDWILGTGSKAKGRGDYAVYAMRVTETMTFNEYWDDPRFRKKRSDWQASRRKARGDNIYHRDHRTNKWRQLPSCHSNRDGTQNQENTSKDTNVDRVLLSDDFIYWGGEGQNLPNFRDVNICCGRNYRCNFPKKVVGAFVSWIRGFDERGRCGTPLEWD